jgi:hypothetical protein
VLLQGLRNPPARRNSQFVSDPLLKQGIGNYLFISSKNNLRIVPLISLELKIRLTFILKYLTIWLNLTVKNVRLREML